uniref:DUF7149 domain-containing protein n=1 Tax=Lunatibacter salilacus TaxID=2483804 RepID=UPI00131D42D4|nr:TaqI-like C-terminal specificity domain-containing protein [Lunatibacter salilacus]
MTDTFLKPKQALNKAFLKVKPTRAAIESYKANLIRLIDQTNASESEEFHKNLVSEFLKNTYYEPSHYINTKGRNDLVIHNGDKANSPVGVILEAKKPTNRSELLRVSNINSKACQELLLYFLRERITHGNLELKHLVVTNIHEWFIFDAQVFDRFFAQNKSLVRQFDEFEAGRLSEVKTAFFYKNIAEPSIEMVKDQLIYTYFDIRSYEKPLRNSDKRDDNQLIALFKLLSPEHLLKLPFANDSNTLDRRFYSELLHIIGLTETKAGGKKIIGRNKKEDRNLGSILEDAIIQLDSLDKIGQLEKPSQYGNTIEDRLFNVGLELSITWVNRILFLKLLEAQLITYHKGDTAYAFLNKKTIHDWDELNALFFQVLAKRPEERNDDVKLAFASVPYLNSSLFDPSEIEQKTIMVNFLKNEKTIPVLSSTVLKNEQGKKLIGSLTTLDYLFKFLDAYDFASEGSEEIQEDNKTLINASVLGLIFEKINGYKDGSYFTPGFITMYMCRNTIRRAVIQKFKAEKGWEIENLDQLYDKIEDRTEANELINSVKICDLAVGSGHFLVSALNEIIAVKNDLKILQDRSGKRLKEYHVEVVNDELIVTDEDGELFEYKPENRESHSDPAWDWLRKTYPAIAKHLKPFELAAKRRTDQGDFWWELRACDYYAEFEKEKIIYPNICKRPEFTIDDSVTYTNQKCFIISKFDKSLLGILNSKLCNFLFHQILPKLRGDFFEPSYIFFKDFPILKDETGSIELLVDKIISVKKENPSADIFEWEDQIDQLVYELYGLSEEEIGIVDKSTIK